MEIRGVCEEKSKGMIGSASSSAGGFLYSDSGAGGIHAHMVNSMQHHGGFEGSPEIFNLSSSMEMIGFNKSFFMKHGNTSNAPGPSSSSSSISKLADFYHHHHHQDFVGGSDNLNMVVGAEPSPWHDQNRILLDEDSNMIRCVFPCEGNERPSQGLSLSLSSTNPTSIGLQSFELRHPNNQLQQMNSHHHQGLFQLRNSKFLGPAQELLNEFVSLGPKQTDKLKQSISKNKQWDHDMGINGNGSSSSRKQALSSLEFVELQKRKAKLLAMLEEVDRRYKHYCDQMKAVVSSFEAVAGLGSAAVYSALASKAMSRHFRCLRDGIVGQIQETRKAMGEKDPVAPGGSRGDTPRLRVLDQTLRQQRAFQQMTMMESHPWRPQRGLPERSVSVLRAWLFEHFLHPYPSDVDKHILARQTGLSRSQVSNWFINARVRLWKPMIEEMYMEELKEREAEENNDNMASNSDGILNGADIDENDHNSNSNPHDDQKPGPEQLVRVDSECLSSIVTNSDKNELKVNHRHQQQHHHGFGNFGNGPIELEFSSYNNHHHNGGVSLTLGLQQHAGSNGVSLAFSSPAVSQTSMFYGRDQMEDCQPVQYSLLDGEAQHLPYRNLMGAQLLHDLAG